MTTVFADGSVSLRLYPHNELDAPVIVDELRRQAALAVQHGFDGVMTAEHHGGFAGYLPNPLQAASWMLDAMPTGWAAPCPLLLTLRPTALVAEEVAWLAARFPGRVGIGVAAGALEQDFDVMGSSMGDLTERFATGLETLVGLLNGAGSGPLAGDPALRGCRQHPVPVVSAAMGVTAARRAARLGAGLLFDSLTAPERARQLADAYQAAGGAGPRVLIRRAWVGEPPAELFGRQVDVYRTYSSASAQQHWSGDQLVCGDDPDLLISKLAVAARQASAGAINLRVHVPGVTPTQAREQIEQLGESVVPGLQQRLVEDAAG